MAKGGSLPKNANHEAVRRSEPKRVVTVQIVVDKPGEDLDLSQWSKVITPKRPLLSISWRELWQYRDLIALLVHRDFVATYKQTILGPIWFLIQPLMTTVMFVLVFNRIAKLP